LLPFCIIRLRREARQAKTAEERRKVGEGFKELGIKLKEAIEGGKYTGRFDETDIVTLLERLYGLVDYVGKGYETTEVKEMLDTSMMGYGQVLLMRGEQRGRLEGEQCGRLEGEQRGRLEGERRGKLEGERKGKLEGKLEGRLEGKLETARNALKVGIPMRQIAQITGISEDELKKQLG
jgi:predicted transposase/invertase (TIGR01784 family)